MRARCTSSELMEVNGSIPFYPNSVSSSVCCDNCTMTVDNGRSFNLLVYNRYVLYGEAILLDTLATYVESSKYTQTRIHILHMVTYSRQRELLMFCAEALVL